MAAALLLGQFQLGEVIGKGAFGSVYRSLNVQTGDFVAIKKYDVAEIPEKELLLLVEEANLMRSLNHENIVQFYGAAKDEASLYLIMEYVENGSVTKIMKTFGNFPESLVRVYTEQVLKGLVYLHSHGVLHRDIKGCNILVNKEGVAKLADFGVSSKVDETQKKFSVVGTPYWMSPEMIQMAGAGLPSDIWSLGCTIIELLTGSPPYYELASMTALFQIVKDPHPPLPPNISPELSDFLLACFKKDPARRPPAAALLNHSWIANPKCASAASAIPRPARQPRPRRNPIRPFGDVSDEESDLAAAISEGEAAELAEQRDALLGEVDALRDKVKEMTLKLLMAVAEKGEALKLARLCLARELTPQHKAAIGQRIDQLEQSGKVDIEEEKKILSSTALAPASTPAPSPAPAPAPSPAPAPAPTSSPAYHQKVDSNPPASSQRSLPPSTAPVSSPSSAPSFSRHPTAPAPTAASATASNTAPSTFSSFAPVLPRYQDASPSPDFLSRSSAAQAAEMSASWNAPRYAAGPPSHASFSSPALTPSYPTPSPSYPSSVAHPPYSPSPYSSSPSPYSSSPSPFSSSPSPYTPSPYAAPSPSPYSPTPTQHSSSSQQGGVAYGMGRQPGRLG